MNECSASELRVTSFLQVVHTELAISSKFLTDMKIPTVAPLIKSTFTYIDAQTMFTSAVKILNITKLQVRPLPKNSDS